MKIKIKSNYLVFNTKKGGAKDKLRFLKDGTEVYNLDIALSKECDYAAFIPVSRYIGDFLEIKADLTDDLQYAEADELPKDRESVRPLFHFSPKRGWNNDPNGLIYYNGKYVMFYQYNPADIEWGNMHWGRAESEDLIVWKECEVALFPDANGTVFSGSAILDERSVSGLGEKPVLLYFTYTGKNFTQRLAFTFDFKTFNLYDKDVIPFETNGNRDPKTVYSSELGCYLTPIYVGDDDKGKYSIYQSYDLIHFTKLQEIRISDDECPDLFPITSEKGERKWVFMGASGVYLVGDIVGGKFVPVQGEKRLNGGSDGYAGQTFSGLKDRVVRIEWLRWNSLRGDNFSQSMTLARELSLKKVKGKYYLLANIVREMDGYLESVERRRLKVTDSAPVRICAEGCFELSLCGKLKKKGKLNVMIGSQTAEIDFAKRSVSVAGRVNPIAVIGKKFNFSLFVDNRLAEITIDGGSVNFAVCDEKISPVVSISSDTAYSCKLTVKRYGIKK